MEPLYKGASSPAGSIEPKVLRDTIEDLQVTSPLPGLIKALSSLPLMGVCIWFTLTRESIPMFVLGACLTGVLYSSIFLLTHDCMHHTLTGWKWFDEIFPRIIAYPMLWYHGIYAALHKIHHKMNGNDINDPERAQWTEDEYIEAYTVGRWSMRNKWWLNMFVWGGFGFLFKHYWQAYKFYKKSRQVRLAIWTDVMGVLMVQGFINAWAIHEGAWLKTFAYFIIMERIMGMFHQFRSHIEHYGLWGRRANAFETQIRNSRNIRTSAFVSFYMTHLNYHSVHHAFPKIPFYKLKEAHGRLIDLYRNFGMPMDVDDSYLKTGLRLARNPVVIATRTHTGANKVIPVSQLDLKRRS